MKRRLTLLLVGLLGTIGAARIALSDTFTVTNPNDSGSGSLRLAITDANAHSNSNNPSGAPDLISFAIPGDGPPPSGLRLNCRRSSIRSLLMATRKAAALAPLPMTL